MKKIAITGPECSGKTTISFELAKYFGVVPAEEYAVQFLEQTNGAYKQEDLDVIAEGQLRLIESVSTQPILISDTEMTVLKIWSQYKFGDLSPFIEEAFKQQEFDLYVLCKPDIEFEAAPFRENPNEREKLFELYREELKANQLNFIVCEGSIENRMSKIIRAIKNL